jgi:hypothetical protein
VAGEKDNYMGVQEQSNFKADDIEWYFKQVIPSAHCHMTDGKTGQVEEDGGEEAGSLLECKSVFLYLATHRTFFTSSVQNSGEWCQTVHASRRSGLPDRILYTTQR